MKFDPTGCYFTPHPDYWSIGDLYRDDANGPNFAMQATVRTEHPHRAFVEIRLAGNQDEFMTDLTREDVRELRKFMQRLEKRLVEKEGEE